MKYSIIIVAYKDYESLRKCVASVACSSIQDYEIIIVDNTPPDFIQGLKIDAPKVLLMSNGINHGFSEGCNIGAEKARGDTLIFLNPDTQVFGNWADDMAAGLDEETVAIGPVSNYVAGMQQVERYGGEDYGFIETKLLIGFCLMVSSKTFKSLDGMDEDLFLGCDDLDLSWRIGRMGLKMKIATGVFVHHEGHTSMKMNPEKDRLIGQSECAMRDKLRDYYREGGEPIPTSEEIWGCKILATELKPHRLSVCMIVENQDQADSIVMFHYADEVVIHVAGKVKSFSKARNEALAKCTGDWVLWVDFDDSISYENGQLIHALIHKPGNNVALKACHFAFKVENMGPDGLPYQVFHQPRLFPRLPGLEWGGLGGCKGFVHESYFDNATALGLPMVLTNITIQHHGYSDRDTAKKKQERNLRLLKKEPDNCFTWYNIGTSYMDLEEYEDAETAFCNAIAKSQGENEGFIDNLSYCLGLAVLRQGRRDLGLQYFHECKKPDALFMSGSMMIEDGQVEEGCDLLWKYLKMGEITDVFGTHCPVFRKNAVDQLTRVGVLAV